MLFIPNFFSNLNNFPKTIYESPDRLYDMRSEGGRLVLLFIQATRYCASKTSLFVGMVFQPSNRFWGCRQMFALAFRNLLGLTLIGHGVRRGGNGILVSQVIAFDRL